MSKVTHTLNIAFNNAETTEWKERNLKESKLVLIHEDDGTGFLTTKEVIEVGIILLSSLLEDTGYAGAHIAHTKEE